MRPVMTFTSSLVFTLFIINAVALAELDEEVIKKLLQQIPEVPAIPTKNGHYIFVPSSCNCASNRNQSPLSQENASPTSQMGNNSGGEVHQELPLESSSNKMIDPKSSNSQADNMDGTLPKLDSSKFNDEDPIGTSTSRLENDAVPPPVSTSSKDAESGSTSGKGLGHLNADSNNPTVENQKYSENSLDDGNFPFSNERGDSALTQADNTEGSSPNVSSSKFNEEDPIAMSTSKLITPPVSTNSEDVKSESTSGKRLGQGPPDDPRKYSENALDDGTFSNGRGNPALATNIVTSNIPSSEGDEKSISYNALVDDNSSSNARGHSDLAINNNAPVVTVTTSKNPVSPGKSDVTIKVTAPSSSCNCGLDKTPTKITTSEPGSQSSPPPTSSQISSGSSTSLDSSTTSSSGMSSGGRQLRGVNRSGAEYSCVKNLGIFEGPIDDNAIKNMKKWNINVVRIPLNEDCWLGINGHTPAYIGDNYRQAVINYVKLLRANDLSVVLDLHWSDGLYSGAGKGECVDETAKCQKPMPDAENAPKFWKSVAKQFSGDDNIIFDLFNEPFPDMVYWEKEQVWKCWRDGGDACPNFPYPAAGMQDLVDAVREVNSTNPIMVGGINWSSDLSKWKEYVPSDRLNKIYASWHAYALNPCNNTNCWETMIAPIAKEYPVVVGEIGETDCTHEYIDKLMDWLDKNQISYIGWTWNTWDCRSGPALITDYDGTPTEFGRGLKDHLSKNIDSRITGNQGTINSNDSNEPDQSSSPSTYDKNKVSSSTSSSSGTKAQLRGVNRSGAEYSCVKNLGIFEGPVDDNAIKSMKKWNINVVRIPLNEDCWLGINGHPASYIGSNYQTAVVNYVNLLRKNDIKVILDLHWTDGEYTGSGQGGCTDKAARCQKPMPDKENAPTFWQSVAKEFKNDEDGVIFDLFNEPFPEMAINNKTLAWQCWRDGGDACPGFQFKVAGMQDLLDAVRSTGAKNQVMVSGLSWANDLSQWTDYAPKDSENNIAASWHSYNFNACNNKDCWESQVAPVADKYPVIVGEIGEHGCTHSYIDGLMDWLDEKNISYLGWTWNTWDCSSGPSLITDYNGTPTDYGKGLQQHLAK